MFHWSMSCNLSSKPSLSISSALNISGFHVPNQSQRGGNGGRSLSFLPNSRHCFTVGLEEAWLCAPDSGLSSAVRLPRTGLLREGRFGNAFLSAATSAGRLPVSMVRFVCFQEQFIELLVRLFGPFTSLEIKLFVTREVRVPHPWPELALVSR